MMLLLKWKIKILIKQIPNLQRSGVVFSPATSQLDGKNGWMLQHTLNDWS